MPTAKLNYFLNYYGFTHNKEFSKEIKYRRLYNRGQLNCIVLFKNYIKFGGGTLNNLQ